LVVLNRHWKMTYNLLLEVLLITTSLTMLFMVFNLLQAIIMFASWIRTYTNVKNQNEPQTTFKSEFFQQLIWIESQTCWNLKKKVQNLVWKPKLVVIFKTWCSTIGFYLKIFFSLALLIGKRLCIGVRFGHKILLKLDPLWMSFV
jgi:hypothetical protein